MLLLTVKRWSHDLEIVLPGESGCGIEENKDLEIIYNNLKYNTSTFLMKQSDWWKQFILVEVTPSLWVTSKYFQINIFHQTLLLRGKI